MIHVDNLSISFHGNPLIKEALFALHKRERLGFVGRNGSGKTTFFRLLTGEEVPDNGKVSIQKDYTLGILKQHILFTCPTLIEEAALGLRPEDQDNIYLVEKILFGLGFTEEDLYRDPANFSGGYQLRLHLAKVLVSEPDCLLLDEPTNYLDIVSIRWFARFLQQWKGEFILISHDREFMDSVTTHTLGIHRHQLRKMKGSSVEFFEKILYEEEVYGRTAQNLEKKRGHLQSFVDRFGAKASKAGQAQARVKMIQRIPVLEQLKAISQLNFHFNEAPFSAKKMLEATELNFAYDPNSSSPIVNNFSLSIEKGEKIAIIGKNGRGKSTILKLLAKELTAQEGTIKHSENLSIGYFGQTNIERLHPKNSIEEEISASNATLNITEVKSICGMMMFSGDMAAKPTGMLSGGEKSRVLLGKILATPCNLLLLDEPTHHLDMESIEALIDALEDFQGTVIIVTHSELILNRLQLDKLVVCHEGRQELFLGNYEEFLEKGGWDDKAVSKSAKPVKKPKDQREQRQQRAALIAERAKALKPLDAAQQKLEEQIGKLEEELHQLHGEVVKSSQDGSSQTIQELSKQIASYQTKIDKLYDELDSITIQREEIQAKYTESLEE